MGHKDEFGILLVDDEELVVKSLRRVLRREGFDKVVSALSAEQGIKLLEDTRNNFFLIISDQRMPGMTGSEFLEKSILLSPESRRMLLTAYSDLDAVIDAVNKGEIHQYISKPWNDEDLILRIKGEQDIFRQMQERKRLYKITQHQNTKLFGLASGLKKNLERFTGRLKLKKEEVLRLSQAISEAKEQAEYKEVFLGLEELLSRTITIDQGNLAQAFEICAKEAVSVFDTIAGENSLSFSKPGIWERINISELEDDLFDIIDPIIENVVQAIESGLFGIGAEPLTGVTIDDYKEVPDFGIVTKKDVDRAFRKQLNNFEDSGVTMLLGDILAESGVIALELKDEVMAAQDRTGTRENKTNSTEFSSESGAYVDLQISEDRLEAWMRVPQAIQGTTDIKPVKALIKKRGITFGIVEDIKIRKFIKDCTDPTQKLVVVKGVPASVGKPAEIVYHFNTEPASAGTVNEDGSIDFRSRGESPFVKKGQVLAEKIPMEHPRPGRDIFGQTLEVGEVKDASLLGGDSAELSEDGLKLTAIRQGQPNLDMKGVVSVLEQFTGRGDVNFKTGNICFNGNVLVKGAVTEGFVVECAELICDEINGGTITATGDVKVSNGIVNAQIETQGGVQAKFINRSKIHAFKDMMVTREIMASGILTSGGLDNETGRITASVIAARQGMNVKQIGTEKAAPSIVKIGTDDHAHWIAKRYDLKIVDLKEKLEKTVREKLKFTQSYNDLHVDVANQTFAQDKIIKKIEAIENMIGKSAQQEEKKALGSELKELELNTTKSNERIQNIFGEQDSAQKNIETCDKNIEPVNQKIKELETQKEKFINQIEKDEPVKTRYGY